MEAQYPLQSLYYANIFGHTAAHGDLLFSADSFQQRGGARRNAVADAAGDLFLGQAFRDQRHDFALGENRAHAADGDRSSSAKRIRTEVLEVDFQRAGHDLDEAAGAGGALVVHYEACDGAIRLDGDRFRVLPADINNCADALELMRNSASVTTDLCDLLVRVINSAAAVTGGHAGSNLAVEIAVLEHALPQALRRPAAAGTGENNLLRDYPARAINHNGLGGQRTDIDSEIKLVLAHLDLIYFALFLLHQFHETFQARAGLALGVVAIVNAVPVQLEKRHVDTSERIPYRPDPAASLTASPVREVYHSICAVIPN